MSDEKRGACATCKWARKYSSAISLEPYDGGEWGKCGNPERLPVSTFQVRRQPDYSLPGHECWEAPGFEQTRQRFVTLQPMLPGVLA